MTMAFSALTLLVGQQEGASDLQKVLLQQFPKIYFYWSGPEKSRPVKARSSATTEKEHCSN